MWGRVAARGEAPEHQGAGNGGGTDAAR